MAVRLEMTPTNASSTGQEVPDGADGPAPVLPAPRRPRRFGPGLVGRRPRPQDGSPDDRRLTSRYVTRL
ncbi:hypothetical protein [Prauserella halophila]|uniref:hypothetical protein n=1 Tax=Prauserella halophila TaxID=185641 RepID=UPI0020A367C5|nr:hypothetical protein [Prauserella halophila]